MLKDIRDKKIKAIAVYKLDRISRNVSDFSSLVIELDNYDVSFLSATESIENVTPSRSCYDVYDFCFCTIRT